MLRRCDVGIDVAFDGGTDSPIVRRYGNHCLHPLYISVYKESTLVYEQFKGAAKFLGYSNVAFRQFGRLFEPCYI